MILPNCRTTDTKTILPSDVIILDGILALAMEKIRNIADIKIFIKTASDIRFIRRLQCYIKKRQKTIESIIDQYLTTVKKMHEYFVEPSIKYADIIVPYY